MHLLAMVGVTVLLATVQSAVGSRLAVGDLNIDVIPVLVVAWSSLRGFEEGAILGIVSGLIIDIVSGTPFGLHMTVLALLGGVSSFIDGHVVRANVGLIVSTGVLLTVGYHLALTLGLQALGWQALPAERFLRILFPAAACNTLLLPIGYILSERVYRVFTGWRQMEV